MRTKSARVLLALIITLIAYLIAYSLSGCSEPDQPIPLCDGIEADFYAPQRVHLTIARTDPSVTIVWTKSGHTITVDYPFYAELLLVLCQGDEITINGECVIEAR